MSRKSNDWAWKQNLTPTLKLTLLALADRTDENHECFPSYQRLVNDTNLNIKTIQKNIKELCQIGVIEDTHKRVGKTGQVKVYRFTFKAPQNWNDTKSGTVTKPPKSGCLKQPKTGCYKATQKWATEPPSIEPPMEPPNIEGLPPSSQNEPKSRKTWAAYSKAYQQRYNNAPSPSAKQYKQLCSFIDEVGQNDAPAIAAYYLRLNESWYLKRFHDIGTLLQNAQAIRTQWANGTNQTSIEARQVERQTSTLNAHSKVKGMIERGEL